MARRSLKPQLNQIRTWVRQGRTDAWIAHQLEVSVKDISAFKREHDLEPGEAAAGVDIDLHGPRVEEEEPDLRAADEALVAAALEAEADEPEDEDEDESRLRGAAPMTPTRTRTSRGAAVAGAGADGDAGGPASRSRAPSTTARRATASGSTPPCRTTPVYAEHWAGHRPVTVAIEPDRIVISRAGEDAGANGDDD